MWGRRQTERKGDQAHPRLYFSFFFFFLRCGNFFLAEGGVSFVFLTGGWGARPVCCHGKVI